MFKNELSHGRSSGHLALFTAFAFTLTSTEFQACRCFGFFLKLQLKLKLKFRMNSVRNCWYSASVGVGLSLSSL